MRRQSGFSYIEVLVATALVALLLVPALDGLEAGANAVRGAEARSIEHHHLASKLEEVLALRYDLLDTEALLLGAFNVPSPLLSDPVGAPGRRLVFLSRYDGDDADGDANPFTGVDAGLLWVKVQLSNTPLSFETLTIDE